MLLNAIECHQMLSNAIEYYRMLSLGDFYELSKLKSEQLQALEKCKKLVTLLATFQHLMMNWSIASLTK